MIRYWNYSISSQSVDYILLFFYRFFTGLREVCCVLRLCSLLFRLLVNSQAFDTVFRLSLIKIQNCQIPLCPSEVFLKFCATPHTVSFKIHSFNLPRELTTHRSSQSRGVKSCKVVKTSIVPTRVITALQLFRAGVNLYLSVLPVNPNPPWDDSSDLPTS